MSGWRCDDCEHNPDLMRQRGNCGGPFDSSLERADIRPDGVVTIRGEYCVGPYDAVFDDAHESCPVAAARSPEVRHVLSAWKSWRNGQLALVEPNPSAPMVDAVELVENNITRVNAYEAAMREKG